MISLQQAKHIFLAGMRPGKPDGEIIGFRTAVDKEDAVEAVRRQCRQPFGKFGNGGIVETGIGVEPRPLPFDGGRQPRMRVAEHGHVVDHVEISAAFRVEHELMPAALDLRRGVVIMLLRLGEMRFAPGQKCGAVQARRFADLAQQDRRRGAYGRPAIGLMSRGKERRHQPLDAAELHT